MCTTLVLLLLFASVAFPHMHLYFPPTLKGDNNPYTYGDADPLLNYPYGCCGKEASGLCKGHLDLLDTDEGRPVATWAAGQLANFSLSGAVIETSVSNPKGSNHYGGSCQVGFSVDKGKTFKVATTWQGNCPLRHGGEDPSTQAFNFTIPANIPAGNAVFAWTWVNREKEFNMNCAVVAITSGRDTIAGPTETNRSSLQQPTKHELEDCNYKFPHETMTSSCKYQCKYPTTERSLVERRAFQMRMHRIRNASSLNVPVRRVDIVAFNLRPDMLLDINLSSVRCHSTGSDFELQFPNPGPDVVEGDGEYPLAEPSC